MFHRALGVHELAPRRLLSVHRRGDRCQESAGGRPRQRGGQAGGPGRPGGRDRSTHRPGTVDDADAHQGQPEASLGANGHAGALAELQRPRRARLDQQGRAAADSDRVQGQGVAVRACPAASSRGRIKRRRRNHLGPAVKIADHAISAGQSPALIMSDGDVVSFDELYANSQRVAAALHSAGLRPGDGVALVLPNRPEFFEVTWGCQLSGLYYTAVNTHFTPDEVAYVIDDSDAKAVFVDASMGDLAAHLRNANVGDVHIAVGGNLTGWQSYDDAVATAGDAPAASDGS